MIFAIFTNPLMETKGENMEKLLYNVYAWHDHNPAIRVAEGKPFAEAAITVDAYLNRGLEWDAYMVEQSDDPGWIAE